MSHLALPVTSYLRLSTTPAHSPRAAAPINPVLLHDDIIRPELCNDAMLAGTRLRLSDQTTPIRQRNR